LITKSLRQLCQVTSTAELGAEHAERTTANAQCASVPQ
jgi:hypothetical protein